MTTYRCSMCDLNWPHHRDYRDCLECGRPCHIYTRRSSDDLVAPAEALRIKSHRDFEKWVAEYDRKALEADADALAGYGVLLFSEITGG